MLADRLVVSEKSELSNDDKKRIEDDLKALNPLADTLFMISEMVFHQKISFR